MTDRRPQRDVLLSALRRFWFVALPAGLIAAAVTFVGVSNASGGAWAGEATFIVPVAPPSVSATGAEVVDPTRPGDLSESYRFAQSYAVLLGEDGALVDHLAEQTGLAPDEVVEGTQAVAVPNSAVIRVTFVAGAEQQVRSYFTGLQQAFDGSPALTANIPPGNVRLLQEPSVSLQPGLAPLAPVLAVLVLLVVGVGGAVLLERLDPRIRSEADIRELASWPVLRAPTSIEDPHLSVLLDSIRSVGGPGRSVAVVGLSGADDQDLHRLADLLSQAEAARGERAKLSHRSVVHPSTWVVGGTLAGTGQAERLAQELDVTVLAARQGARLSRLTASVQSLADLAVTEVVVALHLTAAQDLGSAATDAREVVPATADDATPHWHDPVGWLEQDEGLGEDRRAAGGNEVSPGR